jgi:hypothetical protein
MKASPCLKLFETPCKLRTRPGEGGFIAYILVYARIISSTGESNIPQGVAARQSALSD